MQLRYPPSNDQEFRMHLLRESDAASIAGGAKPDLGLEPSPRPTQPVPIWNPVFVTDP